MRKNRILSLILLILISFLILSFNSSSEKKYLSSLYPNSAIKKINYDAKLNNESTLVLNAFRVKSNDEVISCYFIKSMGFKDYIYYLVEIDERNEVIKKIHLIDQNETEDYGGYIEEGWFLERFKNISIYAPTEIVKVSAKKENQICAITGATITSLTASEAANKAMENFLTTK